MTLRQLAMLRAVLARGSLSGAAAELGLSQPAVSMQMKALANELGVPLLEPRGRRLEPTAAGATLAEYAERILRLASDAATAARLKRLDAAVVRVAASSTPGVNLLPGRIAAYARRRPEVVVRLEVLNSQEVERKVSSGQADFGVLGGLRTNTALVAEHWCDDELVLIVPTRHRLARRRRIQPRQLEGETLLVREAGSATRATIEAAFLRSGLPLPQPHVLGDSEAIKSAVGQGLGVAIVSRFAARAEPRGGLAVVRIEGLDLRRPLQLVRDPARELGPAAERFMEFLRQGSR